MAGYKGKATNTKDLAPKVRASFLVAIENLKKSGGVSDMADMWEEIISNDPAKAFEILAKFVPREMLMEIEQRVYVIKQEPLNIDEWERTHGLGTTTGPATLPSNLSS